MYSAFKRDGKPLYEYARGRANRSSAKERQVTIHALELLACALPDVTFRVTCRKGTYVRTLAEDIGESARAAARIWCPAALSSVSALTLEHSGDARRGVRKYSGKRA